jgi:hypothetical protein
MIGADSARAEQNKEVIKSAADELKHVFDLFTSAPRFLRQLTLAERRLILAQAEAIAEITRQSLASTSPNGLVFGSM